MFTQRYDIIRVKDIAFVEQGKAMMGERVREKHNSGRARHVIEGQCNGDEYKTFDHILHIYVIEFINVFPAVPLS